MINVTFTEEDYLSTVKLFKKLDEIMEQLEEACIRFSFEITEYGTIYLCMQIDGSDIEIFTIANIRDGVVHQYSKEISINIEEFV